MVSEGEPPNWAANTVKPAATNNPLNPKMIILDIGLDHQIAIRK